MKRFDINKYVEKVVQFSCDATCNIQVMMQTLQRWTLDDYANIVIMCNTSTTNAIMKQIHVSNKNNLTQKHQLVRNKFPDVDRFTKRLLN